MFVSSSTTRRLHVTRTAYADPGGEKSLGGRCLEIADVVASTRAPTYNRAMKLSLGTSVAALVLLWSCAALAEDAPAPAGDHAEPARGWLGVGERNVWGLAAKNATSDYGADLLGGAWFLREHLEPIVDIGWSRVVRAGEGPTIDTFRAGGKLAIGSAAEHGQLWAGFAAALVVQAGWLHGASSSALIVNGGTVVSAPAPTTSSLAWAVAPSVSALVQGRLARRFLLGAEVGIEHSIPALQWGDTSVFNSFRVQVGLQLGVILGDPIPE